MAVIDSGIADVPDLGNVVKTLNFTFDASTYETLVGFPVYPTTDTSYATWSTYGTPYRSDEFGHGTHVAGIIAGSGRTSHKRYCGVAPGAHLINLRILGPEGGGYTSSAIEAIEWAA